MLGRRKRQRAADVPHLRARPKIVANRLVTNRVLSDWGSDTSNSPTRAPPADFAGRMNLSDEDELLQACAAVSTHEDSDPWEEGQRVCV